MIEHAGHVPLRPIPWSEDDAAAAVEDIVTGGLERFDAERFWPAHPLDENIPDGHSSFYVGAAGMIWAIDYLGRVGAANAGFDFGPFLPRLIETTRAELPNYKEMRLQFYCAARFGVGRTGKVDAATAPDGREMSAFAYWVRTPSMSRSPGGHEAVTPPS